MRRWFISSFAVLAVALAAVGRADQWLVKLSRESLEALLEPEPPRLEPPASPDVEEPDLADAASGVPDSESIPTPPIEVAPSYAGWTRGRIRAELGALIATDQAADYMKLPDGTFRRFGFDHDIVVDIEEIDEKLCEQRANFGLPARGTPCDRLLLCWGAPDYCEAGAWYYADDFRLAGFVVSFEQGLVIGTEFLPSCWRPPGSECPSSE